MREIAKVRNAYRKHMLAQICTLPEEKFGPAFGMETVHFDGEEEGADYYHFRDNGSRVLAVAHLDTVVNRDRRAPRFHDTERGPMVVSGALDDRLGAYVILGLLPKLGVRCDVLLTVGEEWGASTASHFKPGKDYDWIIEFDRAGTDVVMYQYEDSATREAVWAAGADTGQGSFSDIAYLEQVGVKAFNWGVGYQGNYHSVSGFAYLDDTFAMVAKYMRFHKQNAGITMPHDASDYGRWHQGQECTLCFAYDAIDSDGFCVDCDSCQDCQMTRVDCQCYAPRHWKDDADSADIEARIAAIKDARAASAIAARWSSWELPGTGDVAETADEAAAMAELTA